MIKDIYSCGNDNLSKVFKKIKNNFWFQYFCWCYCNNLLNGENWIDFESEMSSVIKWFDFNINNLVTPFDQCLDILIKDTTEDYLHIEKKEKLTDLLEQWKNIQNEILLDVGKPVSEIVRTMKDVRNLIFRDLENIISALDIYLFEFVGKMEVDKKKLFDEKINPDFVLTFNYTNIYEKNYNSKVPVQHIHGIITNNEQQGNLVLGIEEYLDKGNQSNKVNYAIFKKFVQRIRNETGNDYMKILKKIRCIYDENKNVFSGQKDPSHDYSDGISFAHIFGHSLDITDKDILEEFLKSEATAVTIYCRDKVSEGIAIENILRLIDEETLIKKYLSTPSKIKFEILENN